MSVIFSEYCGFLKYIVRPIYSKSVIQRFLKTSFQSLESRFQSLKLSFEIRETKFSVKLNEFYRYMYQVFEILVIVVSHIF